MKFSRQILSVCNYFTSAERAPRRSPAPRVSRFESLEGRDLMALVVDPTFGRRGEAASGFATAVQEDGKLVQSHGRGLIRLNANGSRDTSFQQAVGLPAFATDVSAGNQSNGKVVVASSNTVNAERHFYLTRFNANGSVDETFGNQGTVTIAGLDRIANDDVPLLIQVDDKIVVGGEADQHGVLIRFQKNGNLDSNFGSGGTLDTPFVPSQIVQDQSGRLVAGGWFRAGVQDFKIARYKLSGELDNTFGNAGVATIPVGTGKLLTSLLVQPDGKILASGISSMPSGNTGIGVIVLVRLNADGKRDGSFGTDGIVRKNIERRDLREAEAVLYQGDIVVATHGDGAVLVKFDAQTGAWDRSLGTKGFLELSADTQQKVNLELQPDRGLIVIGSDLLSDNGVRKTSVRLVENDPPKISRIDAVPPVVVRGQSVKLSAVASDVNQTAASLTYHWLITGPNGFRKQLQGQTIDVVLPQPGKYAVALTVSDRINAKARAARSVEVV